MKLCLNCDAQFEDSKSHCPKDGTPLVGSGGSTLIGSVIDDRYKIEAMIGRDAMGVVYKAKQELVGRYVAVKVLHNYLIADQESLKRFQHEARAASRLKHPHIITVFDYGLLPSGLPYLVMDYLEGITLAKVLEKSKHLSLMELLPIISQAIEGLEEAHKNGVIHRDIKPDNIVLVEQSGSKEYVKVIDFGIAKLIDLENEAYTNLTQAGLVGGSPCHMSPERFTNKGIDKRSDIYSMGVVIFECLVGSPPFAGTDLAKLMYEHVNVPPPKLKQVRPDLYFPDALENVVARALAKDPGDRQESMGQLLLELQDAAKAYQSGFGGQVLMAELDAAIKEKDIAPSKDEISELYQNLVQSKSDKLANHMKMREEIASEQMLHLARQRDASLKVKTNVPFYSRLLAYIQLLVPYIMCFVLFGTLIYFIRTEPMFSSIFVQDKGVSKSEIVSREYLRAAQQAYKNKNYAKAKKLLKRVSPYSKSYSEARALMKKLK